MKHNRVYSGKYAGHEIRFLFRYYSTHVYFGEYLEPVEGISEENAAADITVVPKRFEQTKALLPSDARPGYIENRSCIGLVARHLLRWDCCIFHAVAFEWNKRAWLLTAPSGTGKTTQFLNWQRLYTGEIEMICGDMPVVERKDETVFVHPSSWNGKEDLKGYHSAPLGGIVILEQGNRNTVEKPDFHEELSVMFAQMIVRPDTEAESHALSKLIDAMLSVPVIKYVNLGDADSTKLLRTTLKALNDKTED